MTTKPNSPRKPRSSAPGFKPPEAADALRPGNSLPELMREISHKAQGRGLTPEILESILREP